MINNFTIKTSVCEFATFQEFAQEFSLGENDLILTERFLYKDYMEPLELPCKFLFYSDYHVGEPSEHFWNTMINLLKQMPNITRIIGVGGGSILDTAKLLSFKELQSPLDIFEKRIPLIKDKQCICVPSTCGTGSEMDGIIAGVLDKLGKVGIGLDEAHCDQAVLIPELLTKLPFNSFMFCSADALIHCMETAVSPSAHPFSVVYAYEGIRIIVQLYLKIREHGPEERLRYLPEFLRASAYGGICLSHGPCGASHGMAHHFGLIHHLPHGEVNAMFVAPTFKFYARHKQSEILDNMAHVIASAAGKEMSTIETFEFLSDLLNDIVPIKRARDFGVTAADLPGYAERVLETQQRLLIQSYIVPMTKEDLIEIYTDLLENH